LRLYAIASVLLIAAWTYLLTLLRRHLGEDSYKPPRRLTLGITVLGVINIAALGVPIGLGALMSLAAGMRQMLVFGDGILGEFGWFTFGVLFFVTQLWAIHVIRSAKRT
jgi:hypothetical protein